jgi:hypothetical protein
MNRSDAENFMDYCLTNAFYIRQRTVSSD